MELNHWFFWRRGAEREKHMTSIYTYPQRRWEHGEPSFLWSTGTLRSHFKKSPKSAAGWPKCQSPSLDTLWEGKQTSPQTSSRFWQGAFWVKTTQTSVRQKSGLSLVCSRPHRHMLSLLKNSHDPGLYRHPERHCQHFWSDLRRITQWHDQHPNSLKVCPEVQHQGPKERPLTDSQASTHLFSFSFSL